jgi:hypothetical protein
MKRCCACNGRFGLIRYRLAQKSFCSKLCRDKYRADTERKVSRIKRILFWNHDPFLACCCPISTVE